MGRQRVRYWSCENRVTGEVWHRRSLPNLLWRVYAPAFALRIGAFFGRIKESPKDFRYGGWRAGCAWIFKGVSADYEP